MNPTQAQVEAVGMALCQSALGPKQCPCVEKGEFRCADAHPGDQARAAIAALRPWLREGDQIGQRVRKTKGYPFPGVIVADFTTLAGHRRVVVECTAPEVAGCLHIYSPEQLEADHD